MSTAGSKFALVAALLGVSTASPSQNKVRVCLEVVFVACVMGLFPARHAKVERRKRELVPDPDLRPGPVSWILHPPAGFPDLLPGQ